MKLAIIGSRDFKDYNLLKETCAILHNKYNFDHIVSGGARGADKLGEYFADEFNIQKLIFIPDWDKFGKSAGYKRNVDIIENADFVVAFWDGISKGTKHSIDLSRAKNKKLLIVNTQTKTYEI